MVVLSDFSDLDEQEFYTHTYITYQDVCDRGVTHEMVRHRPASYAQESTRYCNYSLGKFGNEVTFVEPTGFSEMSVEEQAFVTGSFELSERCYFKALEKGVSQFDVFFDSNNKCLILKPHNQSETQEDKND
jgi:thymidylate synthase (FAD)